MSRSDLDGRLQGHFSTDGKTCLACSRDDRPHELIDVPAGTSDRGCWMGEGHALHWTECTGCGARTGPWLPPGVGEGY